MSYLTDFIGSESISSEIYPVGAVRAIGSTKPEIEFDGGTYLRSGVLKATSHLTSFISSDINANAFVWNSDTLCIQNVLILDNGAMCITSNQGHISYSEDGDIWNGGQISSAGWSGSAVVVNGRILVIDKNLDCFASEDNGVSWLKVNKTSIPPKWNTIVSTSNHIAYGNNIYVMINHHGSAVSNDGIIWTYTDFEFETTVTKMVFGNGKFVVTNSTKSFVSTDGINWTAGNLIGISSNLADYNLRFLNNQYVLTGVVSNIANIAFSSDGQTWQLSAIPATSPYGSDIRDITYDPSTGMYIASTIRDTNQYGMTYYTATLGTTWTAIGKKLSTTSNEPNIFTKFEKIVYAFGHIYGFTQEGFGHKTNDHMVWSYNNAKSSGEELIFINTAHSLTHCHGKTVALYSIPAYIDASHYRQYMKVLSSNSGIVVKKVRNHFYDAGFGSTWSNGHAAIFADGEITIVYYYSALIGRTFNFNGSVWTENTFHMNDPTEYGGLHDFHSKFSDVHNQLFISYEYDYASGKKVLIGALSSDSATVVETEVYKNSQYSVQGHSKPYITEDNDIIVMTSYTTGTNDYIVVNGRSTSTIPGNNRWGDMAYGNGIAIFVGVIGIALGSISSTTVNIGTILSESNGIDLTNYTRIDFIGSAFIASGNTNGTYPIVSVDGYNWFTTLGLTTSSKGFTEISNNLMSCDNRTGISKQNIGILPYEMSKYVRIK